MISKSEFIDGLCKWRLPYSTFVKGSALIIMGGAIIISIGFHVRGEQ